MSKLASTAKINTTREWEVADDGTVAKSWSSSKIQHKKRFGGNQRQRANIVAIASEKRERTELKRKVWYASAKQE